MAARQRAEFEPSSAPRPPQPKLYGPARWWLSSHCIRRRAGASNSPSSSSVTSFRIFGAQLIQSEVQVVGFNPPEAQLVLPSGMTFECLS